MPEPAALPGSFVLRIDQVGSFRILTAPQIEFSGPQAAPAPHRIRILGPLTRHHARLERHPQGYRLLPGDKPLRWSSQGNQSAQGLAERTTATGSPLQETACTSAPDSKLVQEPLWLRSRGSVELAEGITCQFLMNSPLCQSARLSIVPAERMMDRVEGIVLFDHLLILGPGPQTHICCPHWPQSALLSWNGHALQFRSGLNRENQHSGKTVDLALEFQRYYQQDEIGIYLEAENQPSELSPQG